MSTSYYRPKAPITSFKLVTEGPHDRLSIFTHGKLAGTLVLGEGDGRDILGMMLEETPTFISYYGGASTGMVVTGPPDAILNREAQVVDEYGAITTIGELLDRRGSGMKS